MTTYISLIRGINVSGQKKIKMTDLKILYESIGLKNVRTYIQSGNVVFDADKNYDELKSKIESEIKNKFGFDVKLFIVTKNDLNKIIKNVPFSKDEEKMTYVTFLSSMPKYDENEIKKVKDVSEKFLISGRYIYIFCPKGYGRTKLNNNFFEKKMKVSATTRNWNTINELVKIS